MAEVVRLRDGNTVVLAPCPVLVHPPPGSGRGAGRRAGLVAGRRPGVPAAAGRQQALARRHHHHRPPRGTREDRHAPAGTRVRAGKAPLPGYAADGQRRARFRHPGSASLPAGPNHDLRLECWTVAGMMRDPVGPRR